MTQTPRHHDAASGPDGGDARASQTPGQRPDTEPYWFGQTQPQPRQTSAGSPTGPGTSHASRGPQTPAGPPPPVLPRDGAEQAQPAKPRRWVELTAVASLAALLASGGTYAVTQLDDGSQSSSAANSSTSLGRGTDTAPVKQADASSPNWTATSQAVSPSVVSITVESARGGSQGSGVVIDGKGHVLTNNHVVSGAGNGASLNVTLHDGRTYKATVAGTDPSTDLAVITLSSPPEDLKPIALGNSDDLRVGDPVMAVGNPLGLAGTVTTGIVSALNRPVTTSGDEGGGSPFQQSEPVVTNAIQTSAAINPGNSGGALVNASGQLVGINSSIATLGASGSSQGGSIGIGFAIPVNEAKTIATQLIDDGKAVHAYLGVSSEDGTASDGAAERAGATVTKVWPGTPAAGAGVKTGDTIVAVNGDRVDSTLSLVAHVRERTVGDKVTLTVLRDGKEQKLESTLVARPASTQ
jgi:putative serine protease PepD